MLRFKNNFPYKDLKKKVIILPGSRPLGETVSDTIKLDLVMKLSDCIEVGL